MRIYFYIIIFLSIIISCQSKIELNGKWQRIELSKEEIIPQCISNELGVPLSYDIVITINKDSLTFDQNNKSRTVSYKITNDLLIFLDINNEYEVKWKILEQSEKHLLLERNIGGIDPLYIELTFKKL